jgi:hypothetical protein
VKLYMDESGNGHPSLPLIVGVVAVDDGDAEETEQRIRDLFTRLSARRSLRGLRSFEDFCMHGFHASTDPPEVSVPFLELLQDLVFKAYMVVTDRTTSHAGNTELDKLKFMYVSLLSDLVIAFRREEELVCHIEHNDSLRRFTRDLPGLALSLANEKLADRRVSLPTLTVISTPKMRAMSLAIVDYVMLAAHRWIQSGYSTDVADRKYRGYRGLEHFISLLYSLESGRISSRKEPLH